MKKIVFLVFLVFSIFCYKNNFLKLKADRIYEDEMHSDIIKYFLNKEKGRPNYLKKLDLNKFYRSIDFDIEYIANGNSNIKMVIIDDYGTGSISIYLN